MSAGLASSSLRAPELVLKTTPPRTPRHLLLRPRLSLADEQFRDLPITAVQAPPGYGKTSLLAQWRREHLARGAAVAWVSSDERDDPQRFLNCLVLAVQLGCGRPSFGAGLTGGAATSVGELEGITAWLAEVAQSALELVLIVDEAERLPESGLAALRYLLHNAPPNLRIVAAARARLDEVVSDLGAYGQCVTVGPAALRFRQDETIALVHARLGSRLDADHCARLHELTGGWPLGLQLTLAAMEAARDPCSELDAIAGRQGEHGERGERGIQRLLDGLAAADLEFLTRAVVVDHLHPDLCRALTGLDETPERLARLARDTPFFQASNQEPWSRLHTLAADALRTRFAALPATEQAALHGRAMCWLADHGMLAEAARHAHAAGEHEQAYDFAERSLYEATQQGQQSQVLEWLDFLPEQELDRRPRLRLAMAWALALGERHAQAERQVERILEQPGADAGLRYECALILSGAAYFADEPDRFVALFEPWRDSPPLREPRFQQMHANRLAAIALLRGDPALARHREHLLPHGDFGKAHAHAVHWGQFFSGLSYLWEGQVLLAEETLRPALARVQEELGRRDPLASMLASLLAAAVYEQDQVETAAALLANRLDVLERAGLPEAALLGYRTAARIAAAQGAEHRALDLLDALHALGEARRMPRLCVASLAEQARLHAGRFRAETCRALAGRIDDLLAQQGLPQGPIWRQSVELPRTMAAAHAAIAAQDFGLAADVLARAAVLADALKFDRVRIEIMALRAFSLDRNGRDGGKLLGEALTLAKVFGLMRTFVDAHPALGEWAQRSAAENTHDAPVGPGPLAPRGNRQPADRKPSDLRAVPSMILTPKEREVIELLAKNLANKEIAQALAVGEETVKWHLKNLFGKLDAGNRKHAVRRAQLLGLLE